MIGRRNHGMDNRSVDLPMMSPAGPTVIPAPHKHRRHGRSAAHDMATPTSPGEVAKRRRRAATATKNCVALTDTVARMADLRTPCRSGEARQCRFERAVLPGAAGGRWDRCGKRAVQAYRATSPRKLCSWCDAIPYAPSRATHGKPLVKSCLRTTIWTSSRVLTARLP
jgi:hypothetical protein